jgi:hypothetical protein
MSNACDGQRSSGHLAVLDMVNDGSRRSHDSTDELCGKPAWDGVYVSEHLKLRLCRKDLAGKAKVKTGIGKPDLPGLQGARGNVT